MTVICLLILLDGLPALLGYLIFLRWLAPPDHPTRVLLTRWRVSGLRRSGWRPGDPLVYRKDKASARPGPRARNVWATENGDDYLYQVDKFWTVADILEDGRIVAITRTGKRHCLAPQDPHYRKAGWYARLRYRSYFPHLAGPASDYAGA